MLCRIEKLKVVEKDELDKDKNKIMLNVVFLGQAGLLFDTENIKILVDPYLSDSVAKIQPHNKRRQPIDERLLQMKPNIIVITHNHADHLDKETLAHYLSEESRVTILAPYSAWKELRTFGGLQNNYVMCNEGTTWTESGIIFRAVKAEHSDEYAIGIVIAVENKNYYVTGDTLYSERVFESLPQIEFEAVFLPINGRGNNMNAADAARFAKRIGAKNVIPVHFGMFDDMTGGELQAKNAVVPKIYEEIKLQ